MGPYFLFRPQQDTMEYRKKQRPLKIRMLDGTVKTIMVDDSKTVTDMLMTICARIGKVSVRLRAQAGGLQLWQKTLVPVPPPSPPRYHQP